MKQTSIRSPISTRNSRRRPVSFETTICDSWKRGETCKFGQYCWFAHGPLPLLSTNDVCTVNGEILNNSKFATLGKRIFHSPITQLTPEQQQWILLSQHAQNFVNLPNMLFASRYKDAFNASTYKGAKIPGRTCEEIERQQISVNSSSGGSHRASAMFTPTEQPSLSISCADGSPLSGPSTPVSYSTWFSSPNEPVGKATQTFSIANLSLDSGVDEAIQKLFIPFEKEECVLYKCSQCPFGSNCFFEHLPEGGDHEIKNNSVP